MSTDLTKLEVAYNHAVDNSGKDQFYIFLYRYVETIVKNNQLYGAALNFWGQSIAEDFKNDQQKLEQFTEKVTALANKPSTYQITDFFVSTFGLIDETKLKETKSYYCWYQLYNCFYGLHSMKPTPENIRKIATLDFESEEVKTLLKGTPWSKKDIELIKLFDYGKLADAIEQETQSLTPNKSKLSRDDYLACLTIFHADFVSWLSENLSSPLIELGVRQVHAEKKVHSLKEYEAELTFPVLATPAVVCDGYEYFLTPMTEGKDPWKIVIYCLEEKPNVEVAVATLRDHAGVRADKGIAEALRKSPYFNLKKGGALLPFIYEMSSQTITLKSKVQITDEEFASIKNASKRDRRISR
jgi:hypothetical protein